MSDPGLQPERTTLAWRRTSIGALAVAVLAARAALTARGVGPVPGALLAAAALIGWIGMLALGRRRAAALRGGQAPATGHVLPLAALIVVGYAVLGTVLVLVCLG
ncbi:DUF202 domain-containing protein [Polymorphospora rubra]|uniref:DUF202 domain-containing protein n=1 Tax=Polymorphospora rubra TaxID=338584 RepID=UPI001BB341AF|nr:DUF202 domain-containing protein [Polymorphospora rubra]